MAWTAPRRIVSQPTTITVTSTTEFPAWLPAAGFWGNVNLPAATPRARADATLAGTHGTGNYFTSGRFGGQNPWNDYTGGMWNPFLSTYGAWCVRGGGHATSRSMLDTGTYVWNTGDRLWERYTDPVYPGDLPVEVPGIGWGGDDQATTVSAWYGVLWPSSFSDPKWANYRDYGEITSNPTDGYIPAADHNRMGMVFVKPGLWGMGPKGGLFLACVNSNHTMGTSNQAHIFSFDTRKWSRVGNNVFQTLYSSVSACIDEAGNIYHCGPTQYSYDFRWLPHLASNWIYTQPTNWTSYAFPHGGMVWVPGWAVKNTKGALAVMRGYTGNTNAPEIGLALLNLDSSTWSVSFPGGGAGMSGTLPVIAGGGGDIQTQPVWVDDIGALCMWTPNTGNVHAIYPPSSPFTQNWNSTVMPASGSCGVNTAQLPAVYNKFQYAPALKSFFIVGKADNDDMWCYRPPASYFRSWAPEPGEYADISLTTAKLTAGVDPCPSGSCAYTLNEGQSAIWRDWNGGVFNPHIGTLGSIVLHGGGHFGYAGNEVIVYDIGSRTWSRINNPANYGWGKDGWVTYERAPITVVNSYGAFPDGTPQPLHTYTGLCFVPPDGGGGTQGSLLFMHRPNSQAMGVDDPQWWRFDIATGIANSTTPWTAWTHGPTALKGRNEATGGSNQYVGLTYDSKRKGVWKISLFSYANSDGMSFYSLLTGQQYDVPLNSGNSFPISRPGSGMVVYNPMRDCLLFVTNNGGVPQIACADLSNYTLGVGFVPTHQITQTGTQPPGLYGLSYGAPYPAHLEYCSYDGNHYMIDWPSSATLYRLTVPASLTENWQWDAVPLTPKSGTTAPAFEDRSNANSRDNHLYSRFRYVPAIKSFVWTDGQDLKVQAGRPSNFK